MAASVINQTLQAEAYSELSQTSKMELFAKTVNGFKPLNASTKRSINSISGGVLNAYAIGGNVLLHSKGVRCLP